jgi:hypothetical protein
VRKKHASEQEVAQGRDQGIVSPEQGIFLPEQGIFFAGAGNLFGAS